MESVFPAAWNVAHMSSRPLVALLVFATALAGTGIGSAVTATDAGVPPGDVRTQAGDSTAVPVGGEGVSADAQERTETPVAGGTPTPDPSAPLPPLTTTMRVGVQANGDARWTVTVNFVVRSDAERAAFDELATRFENGDESVGYEDFQRAAEDASAATSREMETRNVDRNGSLNGTRGTLRLSFTWTNFARTEDSRLYVGDGFNTTTGTWLPRLTDRQTLVIHPPSGYGVASAPVGPDAGAVSWTGPRTLDGREPWVVYSGDAPTSTPTPTPTNTTTTTSPGEGTFDSMMPVATVVLAAAVGATVLALYTRRDESSGGTAAESASNGGSSPGAGAAVEPEPDDTSATDERDETDGEPIDETLLSDEERVERLLERNGGRMKQANIVKETGWSNAKVSQLLSAMAEEGRIDKLRIGRENLISFPDEDVADVGLDDEE